MKTLKQNVNHINNCYLFFFDLDHCYHTSSIGVHKDTYQFPGMFWCLIEAVQMPHAVEMTYHEVGNGVRIVIPFMCPPLCTTF